MPVAHGEGAYYADEATLDELEASGQVLFRYVRPDGSTAGGEEDRANPNGSLRAIAGVMNARGQRRGTHATSGDGGRGGPRQRRRPRDHRLVRRLGRGARAGRWAGPRHGGVARMSVAEAPVAVEDPEPLHRRLGVTDDELVAIRERLGGREPNDLELAMFSVMWSEHCSYKSSRPLLRTLPTGTAEDGVVAGPGENAGVISIGDGLAVAFKIESHNHPSAVEPTQGAATGVGGILRDIFTMGARPVAVLDALRFGDPADPRTRHLVEGVVAGVGGYGNCVGVPTIGGELVFDPSYQGNPLVNVMAIGLLEERRPDAGCRAGRRQPRRPLRLDDRPRRDRRGKRPRERDLRGRRPIEAAFGPGRRSVRGEAADRGVARADPGPARRRAPGPRRGRDHLRDLGDGGPGRDRDADRARRDPASRARRWSRSRS